MLFVKIRLIHRDIKKKINKKKIFLSISKLFLSTIDLKINSAPVINMKELIEKFPTNIAIG